MPSQDKISLMTAAVVADVGGSAGRIEMVKAYATVPTTLGLDFQVLRTSMFAGSTGYTATDPLVCGAISTSGDFAIATSKFTVAAASGNTAVAGTLAVTGTSTLTGAVGMGIAAGAAFALYIRNDTLTGVSQYGIVSQCAATSAATTSVTGLFAELKTASAAFTTTNGYVFYANAPNIQSTAITSVHGVYVANQGQAKSTNAYGVYIAAQSGAATTNIGLYNAGTTTLVGAVSGNAGITAGAATAITAGGSLLGLMLSSTASFGVFCGSGAPSISAAKGSLYLRSDGSSTSTRAYIATDAAGTWTAITTAA